MKKNSLYITLALLTAVIIVTSYPSDSETLGENATITENVKNTQRKHTENTRKTQRKCTENTQNMNRKHTENAEKTQRTHRKRRDGKQT